MVPLTGKDTRTLRRFQMQSIFYMIVTIAALGVVAHVLFKNFKPVKTSVFEDAQTGVTLKYPSDWKRVDRPAAGAIVAFLAPKKEELQDFTPNMNVTYVDLKEKVSMAQLKQQTMMQMGALFKGKMKIIEDTEILLAGHQGNKIIFVGVGFDSPLQYLNAWTMIGNRVYVVTYSNRAAYFNDYINEANAVLGSFRVTAPPPTQ